MVSTCVDSALNELTQLERKPSLLNPMKLQIQNLQLNLRFLKMFFWCLENWDDAANNVLTGSDMVSIKDTLRRAGHGLSAAGWIAIREDQTNKWDLMSSNLLEKIEQIKPEIKRICLDLLDRSLQCTYSTSQQILEFIGAILKNLKDFLKYSANNITQCVKQQITVVEEILGFLRNFVIVTEEGIIMYEQFQDFWNHVQTRANNAACVLFLRWIGGQTDEKMALNMSNILSDSLQQIKPSALELTGMYLGVLKASEPSESDLVMTNGVIASFVDFLLQYLPVSYVPVLGDGLMFLIAFLVHPPSEIKGGQHLFTEADAILSNFTSSICSLFLDRTNEDIDEERHDLLLDFHKRVDSIKVEVKRLYVETSDLSWFNFPKTNGLGFIDFFVEKLKEMVERKGFLKPFEKEKIATIKEELLLLKHFLKYSFDLRNEEMEIESLWMRILNVTYKAEHVIDYLIHSPIWYSIICLSDVIEELKNINTDIKRMEEDEEKYKILILGAKMNTSHIVPSQDKISTCSDNTDVVGFDVEAKAIMDLLIGGSRELQIVSIFGMPGVGKTTLANKVYNDQSVKFHFHKCAWCSVSQSNISRDLLLRILECLDNIDDRICDMMKEDLAHHLRQCLSGYRYLIVIDDIWEITAWNELKDSFPNGDEGSRIIFTSRIDDLAPKTQLPFTPHRLKPLDNCKSWQLFEAKLGGEIPPYLKEVAEKIVQNCEGLPLAIVIVAGLLSREDKNLDLWRQMAQNLSSFVDRNGEYKEILELSYKYLPDHLKPFFLYFGAFQKDKSISVQKLIQLWSAEGFVPKMTANIENVAKEYLKDLTARSLVIVTNRGSNGEIKACRMHNLLRIFCLDKINQESFLQLLHISEYSSNPTKLQQYRLCIYPEWLPFVLLRPTGPHVRSLLFSPGDDYLDEHPCDSSFFSNFKLLRVLNLECISLDGSFPTDIILLVHLRYLAIWGNIFKVPKSIEKLWNLETFRLKGSKHRTHLPNTIWNMKRLRHVDVSNIIFCELELEESTESDVETFGTLKASYGEDVNKLLRRLAKVRKLRCTLSEARNSPRNNYQIPELHFPSNLRSLNMTHNGKALHIAAMKLPETLEKLTLSQCDMPWSQISIIGKLPNLQVLKLKNGAFGGETWDLHDNEFPKLKFLKLLRLDIAKLNPSSDPFPKLERLVLERCLQLVEIPDDFGAIPTLTTIEVRWCMKSAAASARKLHEDFDHLEVLIM